MAASQPNKRPGNRLWLLVLILSLLLIVGGAGVYIFTHPWWQTDTDPKDYHNQPSALNPNNGGLGEDPTGPGKPDPAETVPTEPETDPTEQTTEPELPDNPIDFEALQEVNPSVYAWIYMEMGDPFQDIDYPILQSEPEEDDNFYLHHNLNKAYQFSGCIYTQKKNSKDFTDRVTLVYGHNMLDGTMFSNLVYLRDANFFEEHEVFYIYTPGHILTYRIAAAIQFDDRHILNSFDFSDDEIYESWIRNYILEPKTMLRAVREGIEVTTDDRIVILSTCLEHGKYRYLVQGVLVNDEPTK